MLAGEHFAGAPETGNYFIGDEEATVTVANFP